MDNVVINELNALLKGEQMAINAYERFIQNVDDEIIKKEFQDIQKEHRKHIGDLSERIQNLGGNPEYGTGLAGLMASAVNSMQNINDNDSISILKHAYDGEDKGIAKAEEIVKGDLDEESARMVEQILSDDHNHLRKMLELIANREN